MTVMDRRLRRFAASASLAMSIFTSSLMGQPPPSRPATGGVAEALERPQGVEDFRQLRGHSGSHVLSFDSISNGRRLVSSGRDRTLTIWDWATGREERTLCDPNDRLRGTFPSHVVFSADGRRVASAGPDLRRDAGDGFRIHGVYEGTSVKVWDVETGRMIGSFGGLESLPLGVALNRDGTVVTACDGKLHFKTWDCDSGREIASHKGTSRGKDFHPSWCEWASCKGSRFAINSSLDSNLVPDYLYSYDASNGKERIISPSQREGIGFGRMAFTGDGRRIVIVSYGRGETKELVEIDFDSGTEVRRVPLPPGGGITSLTLSPDERFVSLGDRDGRVSVFHRGSGYQVQSIVWQDAGTIRLIDFTGRGLRILSGGGSEMRMDGSLEQGLKVWDVDVSFSP